MCKYTTKRDTPAVEAALQDISHELDIIYEKAEDLLKKGVWSILKVRYKGDVYLRLKKIDEYGLCHISAVPGGIKATDSEGGEIQLGSSDFEDILCLLSEGEVYQADGKFAPLRIDNE